MKDPRHRHGRADRIVRIERAIGLEQRFLHDVLAIEVAQRQLVQRRVPGEVRQVVGRAARALDPTIERQEGILDPQGKAIEGALKSLGVDGISSVRQGKVFDIEIAGSDKAKAEAALKDAADKLLANTVIENYRVEIG